MFTLKHLSKTFRSGDIETTALDRIDLEIEAGEYLAITGPSGCGKSTLLGILGLLDAPSSGEYWFDGQDVARWSERQLNTLRRGRIGFVFQSFNLIDDLSVADNIALALEYGELPARERRARVAEVMERLGLTHRAGHRPSQLSGGQQQRVAIARAIAARPALLLADEPTGNLDRDTAATVFDLMLQQAQGIGTAFILVTHDRELASRCQSVRQLVAGRFES